MDIDAFNFEHQMDMELSKNSFPYFFQNVLGWDFASHQQEWLELMNDTQRTVIICSRGHGKSVFMHSWVVWNLVFREPPYQMLYISSNQKQTLVHMRDIDKLFTHPMLKKYKPAKGWAIGNITLTNGNQILERSVGSQIRGLHPQEIIIDDPLKEFSMTGIQKVTDWFYGDMIPTLHHTASLRVIGTPFSYTDIYQQLSENPAYTLRTYPCLNALNEPLWPNRWDYDALMARKAEVGSLMFTREYMCVPISTGTSLFNPEYLEAAKSKDHVLKPMRREGYKYYVGIDPAISTDGDYNVITVLEVDENDNKTLVYIDRSKNVEFRENIQKVKLIGKVFHPEAILFETNTFAKTFTQEIRNVTDLNVHDFNTTRKKKEEIILSLQMNFENGKIILPYANEESRRVTSTLIEELSMFAITDKGKFEGIGAHDDMVMSLALANAATHTMSETFILLDDMGIFDPPKVNKYKRSQGVMGINFLGDIMVTEQDLIDAKPKIEELERRKKEEEPIIEELGEALGTEIETDRIQASVNDYIMSDYEAVNLLSKNLNINASDARKQLSSFPNDYSIDGENISDLVKKMRKARRKLKGEQRIKMAKAIDTVIDGYSDHINKCVDSIYWLKPYKPAILKMGFNEKDLRKINKIDSVNGRRDIIDAVCKYWEGDLKKDGMAYSKEYAQIEKECRLAKRDYKKQIKNITDQSITKSKKERILSFIESEIIKSPSIGAKQIHDRMPNTLHKSTTTNMISKMVKKLDVANVDGAYYKLPNMLKKNIWAYTAAFIDSDGYITMDRNHNPRVGLIATGERGRAFMEEMHKSIGYGKLHLNQKSPQQTRPVQRLNFYSQDDVMNLLTKCLPHFRLKKGNAKLLMELIRMKKSYKKQDWYKGRCDEIFKLMKWENHKDHVGFDWLKEGIYLDNIQKYQDNCKMSVMDDMENIGGILA